MTCKNKNRSKTTKPWMAVINFVKKFLLKWAGSKKDFSLLKVEMNNGKAIWALALTIFLFTCVQFYGIYKGKEGNTYVNNITVVCEEVKGK